MNGVTDCANSYLLTRNTKKATCHLKTQIQGPRRPDIHKIKNIYVSPPVLLCQLLHGDCLVGWRPLLDLVLVILPADDLEVDPVLARDILLLFKQNGRIPEHNFKD